MAASTEVQDRAAADAPHRATAHDPGSGALTAEDCPRPLRADARRNRDRILMAARKVFADHGAEAQMDDVARRAKVGVGTVYRHFPTKDALLRALAADKFERLRTLAEEALKVDDPWAGFEHFVWAAADQMAEDRMLSETIFHNGLGEQVPEAVAGLERATGAVLSRAQAAGTLRADFAVRDIRMMMCGLGAAMQFAERDRERWQRYLRMMLDGLRLPVPAA